MLTTVYAIVKAAPLGYDKFIYEVISSMEYYIFYFSLRGQFHLLSSGVLSLVYRGGLAAHVEIWQGYVEKRSSVQLYGCTYQVILIKDDIIMRFNIIPIL